jgi:biopolymer transport protein ExbD
MSMRSSGKDDNDPMVEMNVTPLVDVMLVLLVIFIVTAPLIVPRAIKIDLPRTGAAPGQNTRDQPVLLIQADGRMSYKNQFVSDAEFIAQLQSDQAPGTLQLQVHADASVTYGRMAQVMALAQSAGVHNLSFMTLPEPKSR